MEFFENDPPFRQGLSHRIKIPLCFVSLLFVLVPGPNKHDSCFIIGCMEIPKVGQRQNVFVDVKTFLQV